MRKHNIILALVAAVSPLAVAAAEPDAQLIERGRKVYVNKCARCHKFYDPASYDDASWDMWMKKMKRKSRLNDDDYQRLDAYVGTLRNESTR